MKRLAVIPSDPLKEYFDKGYSHSWLESYYNPCKYFDEVYLLSGLEEDHSNLLGMRVIHTPAKELTRHIQELNIDVVRAYGGNWACEAACEHKVRGVPVVVSIHDKSSDMLYGSIKKADFAFCVSKAVKDLVMKKFHKPERLWILPNRVNCEVMRPYPREDINDLAGQFPFRYKILHVGRVTPDKNLDTLIQAMKLLGPEFCLIAVGQGNKDCYQALVEEQGVKPQIFFIDAVEHNELARYYSMVDCMCTPSRSEGFGIVFIEALACEAVVVTSDIPPMNEYIVHRENGLLVHDFENPQALAQLIQQACCDQELRRKLKSAARESVRRFEKNTIDQLEAGYYEKIMMMKKKENEFSRTVFSGLLRKNQGHKTPARKYSISPRKNIIGHYTKAIDWIAHNTIPEQGIIVSSLERIPYMEVTGYMIPTLMECGEYKRAEQYADFLSTLQRPNGSFAGPDGREYIFDSGQVLRGLITASKQWERFKPFAKKTADFLISKIQEDGRMPSIYNSQIPEAVHLFALRGVVDAAEMFHEPVYAEKAKLAVQHYKKNFNILDVNLLTHFLMYIIDGFIEMGEEEFVRPAVEQLIKLQKKDGRLPALPAARWTCSPGQVQFAIICYKLKYDEAADKALDNLCTLQNSTGGFYGSYGPGRTYFPKAEISWANKFFLDAVHLKIQSFFNHHADIFPKDISAEDGRLKAITVHLQHSGKGKILDAGCGKGRFAKQIKDIYPSYEVHGVDISEELLKDIPESVIKKTGSLLNIPYPDETFDMVFCVEALAHTLRIEKVLKELVRVLKSDGILIIIDKNSEKLGRLEITDFEQWFDKQKMVQRLSKGGSAVEVKEINYDRYQADGLFLCWTVRKGSGLLNKDEWHEAMADLSLEQLVDKIRKNDFPVWVQPLLKSTQPGESILETGSGTGELAAILSMYGRQMQLLDYSPKSIEFTKELFQKLNLKAEFHVGDILKDLPMSADAIDWVFSSGVLEHFTDDEIIGILQRSKSISRKGVISLVPNANALFYRLGKFKMEQEGSWRYGKEIPKFTMRNYFEAAGLKKIKEYSVGSYHALAFDDSRKEMAKEFFDQLSAEELQTMNQGYLLFTIGEKHD